MLSQEIEAIIFGTRKNWLRLRKSNKIFGVFKFEKRQVDGHVKKDKNHIFSFEN